MYLSIQIVFLLQVQFILNVKEHTRILEECHRDSTSGHMGTKQILSRITDRFIWPGVTKDVNSVPYSTYYNPMMYYKPTPLFSSKFLHRYRTLIYVYKPSTHFKPTPLFRADVWAIAHGLIIRSIRYMYREEVTYMFRAF